MTSDASAVNTKKQKNTHTEDEALEVVPTAEPETQELHVRNVHQRLNDARQVLRQRAFTKDLSNKQFSSVSIDAMRDAVQEAIISAGLNLILVDKQFTLTSSGPTKTFMGTAKMRVINVDDPSDYVEYWTESYANDNGDKGLSKWDTGLLKTAYKEIFQIGERGKDDIDSYSNEELESEAERIEAIRARRTRAQEAPRPDPFFGDPLSSLRKRIGAMLSKDGPDYVEGAEDVVNRYKAEHGQLPQWTKDILEQCIKECKEAGE